MVLHEMAEQRLVVIDECLDVRFVWQENYHEGITGHKLLGDLFRCDHCAIIQSYTLAF